MLRLRGVLGRRAWKLQAYLDGSLAPRERDRVEQALSRDAELRRHLAELHALRTLARAEPLPSVEDERPMNWKAMAAGAEAREGRRSGRWWWAMASAGAAAVLAAGVWVGTRPHDAAQPQQVAMAPSVRERAPAPTARPPAALPPSQEQQPAPRSRRESLAEGLAAEAPMSGSAVQTGSPGRRAPATGAVTAAEAVSPEQTVHLFQERTAPAGSAAESAARTLAPGLSAPAAAAPPGRAAQRTDAAPPLLVRIVQGAETLAEFPLRSGVSQEFRRGGIVFTVGAERRDDGRWTLSTTYRPPDAEEPTETLDWYAALEPMTPSAADPQARDRAADEPILRRRIAQPINTAPRLYIELRRGDASARPPDAERKDTQ